MLKLDYDTLDFNLITTVENFFEEDYHTVIDSTDESMILNALSPRYLFDFLMKNVNNNYVFLTLNYGCNIMDSSHQTALCFDTVNKKVFMIDPNGKSDFFDNVFNIQTNKYVEILLSNYISLLSEYGLDYEFLGADVCNPKKYAINKRFNNEIIGHGHCVITTLILVHLINGLNINPSELYLIMESLDEEELIFIIKGYSLAVYYLLKQ